MTKSSRTLQILNSSRLKARTRLILYFNFDRIGRVESVKLSFQMAGVLLRSGHATDDDMQSLASLLTTNTLDIGNLDDFR